MGRSKRWAEMMVAAQGGDAQMYNVLLTEVSQHLRGFLNFKLNSSADVNDVLQEILISVHNARHSFNGELPFNPWLFAIAQSRLIDFWRKNKNRSHAQLMSEADDLDYLVAEAEISSLDIKDLEASFNKLSENQWSVLKGLKLDGKSIKDLAQELSMSESAVKVTAHRAYKSVAEDFGVEL